MNKKKIDKEIAETIKEIKKKYKALDGLTDDEVLKKVLNLDWYEKYDELSWLAGYLYVLNSLSS